MVQARGEERREQIMGFIRSYAASNGFAPSMQEIGDAIGLSSTNGIRNHLLELQRQGLIVMAPGTARSITLAEPATEFEQGVADERARCREVLRSLRVRRPGADLISQGWNRAIDDALKAIAG